MDHNILDEVLEVCRLSLTYPLKGTPFVGPLKVMDNLETIQAMAKCPSKCDFSSAIVGKDLSAHFISCYCCDSGDVNAPQGRQSHSRRCLQQSGHDQGRADRCSPIRES
jgi:hypothetical protein